MNTICYIFLTKENRRKLCTLENIFSRKFFKRRLSVFQDSKIGFDTIAV